MSNKSTYRQLYVKKYPERVKLAQKKWRETHRKEQHDRKRAEYAHRKFVVDLVKDVPCQDCGIKYPPYIMQFDHVKGRKHVPGGSMLCLSLPRMYIEITKCEIVCANCHQERTEKRRQNA
jgi:hypothetical protein